MSGSQCHDEVIFAKDDVNGSDCRRTAAVGRTQKQQLHAHPRRLARGLNSVVMMHHDFVYQVGAIRDGGSTGDFWSLSVEEHFYLLLSAVLVFTRKKHRLKVLSALILFVAISLAVQLRHRSRMHIQYRSDVRLDSLLIPAMIAVLV